MKSIIHNYSYFYIITYELTLRPYLFYLTCQIETDFLIFSRVRGTLLLIDSRFFPFLC